MVTFAENLAGTIMMLNAAYMLWRGFNDGRADRPVYGALATLLTGVGYTIMTNGGCS